MLHGIDESLRGSLASDQSDDEFKKTLVKLIELHSVKVQGIQSFPILG